MPSMITCRHAGMRQVVDHVWLSAQTSQMIDQAIPKTAEAQVVQKAQNVMRWSD